MEVYRFIAFKGNDSKKLGYRIPRLYPLFFRISELKQVGFWLVKERLKGWTIWFVTNDEDYKVAKEAIKELKKSHKFDFKVGY